MFKVVIFVQRFFKNTKQLEDIVAIWKPMLLNEFSAFSRQLLLSEQFLLFPLFKRMLVE